MSQSSRHPAPTARARLAALREKKAPTKAAQIRALWPDIKTALDNGHNLQSICECLEADGISVSPRSLASYVSRIRKLPSKGDGAPNSPQANHEKLMPREEGGRSLRDVGKPMQSPDPLANIRDRQGKRSGFDYRPELADPKQLI
jgi:hypothetical protein